MSFFKIIISLIFIGLIFQCSLNNSESNIVGDDFPPVVTIVYPSMNSVIYGSVTVKIIAIDKGGVDSVLVYIDGFKAGKASFVEDDAYEYFWETAALEDSTMYLISAEAFDHKTGYSAFSDGIVVTVRDSNPN